MCVECKCGLPGEHPAIISGGSAAGAHGHSHEHDHSHSHDHHHNHPHDHDHPHASESASAVTAASGGERRAIDLHRSILEKNVRQAERNRGFFRARGLLAINVLSSPGSGKTTFIRETIRRLAGRLRAGVIVGDLATDNDAARLRETGAPVVQVTTGTVCHLEAGMIARALLKLELTGLDLLIIENVGNLVCPAAYDLGEDLRIVLLSVTEGEDKPLKYPPMFQSASAAVISKMDLAAACEFDRDQTRTNLQRLAPDATIFEVAARTGLGLSDWCDYLVQQHQRTKVLGPLSL